MIINMTSGGVVPNRILDAQTITPGRENVVFEEGTYFRGAVTFLGDSDFIPENIPEDVNLFGLQGKRPPDFGSSVWIKRDKKANQTVTIKVAAVTEYSSEYETYYLTGLTLTPSDPDYDLANLDMEFFTGLEVIVYNSYAQTTITFNSNNTIKYVYSQNGNSGTLSYTWNPSTGKVSFSGRAGDYERMGSVSGNVAYIPWIDYCYVVNNNPAAYPNGGYQNGFWYDLLAQLDSANVATLSNEVVEEVQQDYRNQIETEVSNA